MPRCREAGRRRPAHRGGALLAAAVALGAALLAYGILQAHLFDIVV